MNFNIYLDEATGQQLITAAAQSAESKNALIRKAVSEWLVRHGSVQWPDVVLSFNGIADVMPFESARETLQPPAFDPFA